MSSTIYRNARSGHDLPGFIDAAGATTPNEDAQRVASLRKTFYIQLVCTALFFIAFLLYLPIGLAIIDDFKHLTIAQVLSDVAAIVLRYIASIIVALIIPYDAIIICSAWSATLVRSTARSP